MKEINIEIIRNLYLDNEIQNCETVFGKDIKTEYSKEARGSNTVDDSAEKTIDFENISPKALILKNTGVGTLSYKLSGASITGNLSANGVLALFNADVSSLIVLTANAEPVSYEYEIYG